MITIKKLKTLKRSTRIRKYVSLLQDFESQIIKKMEINTIYLNSLLKTIEEDNINTRINELLKLKIELRSINNIRHAIMAELGIEPSEWDFTTPQDKDSYNKISSGINLYLEDIRSPFNLGSIFRTAECFGVEKIILSNDSTKPDHHRAVRTAMGSIEYVNWEVGNIDNNNIPVFALELGGIPIDNFIFPKKGIAIIGSEEFGVSPNALKIADKSLGRVTIPLYGNKSSLNVSNATAILLQRWSESTLKV
ncbi:MAG: TrmH family RNA methyltransferase [Spirochaetales bacterium]|nr:TrmH family RNA methyltransferase [Spirochaetales bacterium]